ncbi:hypothetical protein [Bacillus chungangensis]|uniref:Uncharacterized protein n=1 Tax=Bacillus chungangensis TaxID=587633 RepID=A0ABT9WUL1_9BACI|nr:hypothetical protein [Bacillus chungangensis]MDQ0176979.1 hypothetical protein [Bacillus chungangensis]
MKKQTRKPMVLASALILGMTVFAPIQAGAAEAIKEEVQEIQLEQQQIKGKVLFYFDYELFVKGEDGKRYRIGLHDFTDEQIEQMGLKEDTGIVVKGTVLDSEAFFDSFEAYKRQLPEEITEDDLAKIEVLHKELKALEKSLFKEEAENKDGKASDIDEEKLNQYFEIQHEIGEILVSYYPEADPETFEEFITSYADLSMDQLKEELSSEDFEKLQALYEDYLKLLEKDKDDLAYEKLDEFYEILNSYQNIPYRQSFEEFLEAMKLDISDEDKATLETLFNDARAAEKSSKDNWDMIDEKWNKVYEFLNPYFREAGVSQSFVKYITSFEFEIKEEDLATLEPLYEEIKELTMKKDYEAADKKWEEFFDVLDPYFVEYHTNNPFKAKQIEINGKEFKVEATETVVEKKKEESKAESKEEKATAEKDASKDKSESTSKDA